MIKENFLQATKDILEQNLKIGDKEYSDKSIVLVYDLDSPLSRELSSAYIENLRNINSSEIIDFNKISKEELKDKLLSLEANSTVVLVQSTNFRLDNFRIRLHLHKAGVGCLEHNHLAYMKDDELENYADTISYRTPYYESLSEKLKNLSNNAESMIFVCNDGSTMKIEGGFEDMKQNTGNYEGKNRGGSFPIGENFTEAKVFDKVNGELSIYAYPDEKLQVEFSKPFKIKIEKSIVTCDDSNCPETFRNTLNMITEAENNEVMFRELGFGLNPGITRDKPVSDINAFERIAGFHMSLGKKHQIYRKKLDKKVTQRYHIDIFPDIKEIYFDDMKVFEGDKFLI